jgi:filamentous hemagglutinin family protein
VNSSSRPKRILVASRLTRTAATLLAYALCGGAQGNPTGSQIVAGQVAIVASPNRLLVTNSPGAIINWQSFSIMPGELTQFIQQSSTSTVLNRITGQNPSQILGALQSNGRVLLVNPNGIVFGAGARVDVGGLAASSLDVSNADFLAGKLNFNGTGKSGDVINHGAITTPSGGQVYLIAPNVANDGIITSPNGDVMLAAGQSVSLADSTDPDMRVVVSAPGSQALNVGKIVAASGRIGIYGALIDQLGLVSANSAVVGENGKILFKSSGDAVLGANSVTTATGVGTGGTITVLGDRVELTANSLVDASGEHGGGTVLVGGDKHGTDPVIQTAASTYIGPMAQIKADAWQSGDGGNVVVWSNQQTQMYGNISARGGAAGGNGGFVEASSGNLLDFRGLVDLRAPLGLTGTLLLDPTDITIESTTSTDDITSSGSPPFTITGANPSSILSVTDLQNELALGNVTVSSSSSAAAPLAGTILVASPVSWSTANSLTLTADQSIGINAPISANLGTLILSAHNGNITQTINASMPAAISVSSLGASAPNGLVTLTEPTNQITGAIAGVGLQGFSLVNSGTIVVGSVGSLSGISSTGAVTLTSAASVSSAGAAITASTLEINAATGVGSLGNPLATAVGSLQVTNSTSGDIAVSNTGGPLTVADLGSLGHGIQQTGSGSIYIASDNSLAVNGAIEILGATGNVGLQAAGGINLNSPITVAAPGGSVALLATTGDIAQNGGPITAASASAVALQGGVQLTDQGNAIGVIAGSANGSSFSLVNTGSFTVGSAPAVGAIPTVTGITASSALGIGVVLQTPVAGDISLGAPLNAGTSTVYLEASGAVIQAAGGIVTAGSLDVLAGAGGIGSSAAPLLANVSTLSNATSLGSVYISDGGGLTVNYISATGAVNVNSGGSFNTPITMACDCTTSITGSSVTLTASGSMLINSGFSITATDAIALHAGYDAAGNTYSSTPQSLAINGDLYGASVGLFASGAINMAGTVSGVLTQMPSLAPSPPTLAQCVATPALPGCAAVLPSAAQCTATPTLAGCAVVLPTLAQCSATPTLAGCAVVLPTLAQCSATPTLAGCTVVLPSLAQCSATPTLAGCAVVLPSLAQCAATRTLAGCTVVLPSLAQCAATPTLAGCPALPPTLAQCLTTPSAPGCSTVLPSSSAVSAAPSVATVTTSVVSVLMASVNENTVDLGAPSPSSATGSMSKTPAATSATTLPVEKSNDAAKKMYCN